MLLLLLLLLLASAVPRASALASAPALLAAAPKPLCESCASWCAGECSFPGPEDSGVPNSRLRQNITLYRMTPSTVTDLDNKNTGDPPGDLVFNMDERAIPMTCRHVPPGKSGGPDCDGNNTHSWLLEKDLVYVAWEIEVDGDWGPCESSRMLPLLLLLLLLLCARPGSALALALALALTSRMTAACTYCRSGVQLEPDDRRRRAVALRQRHREDKLDGRVVVQR
jgi:hypothetical protein